MESAQELKIAEAKNAERQAELEQWLRADCGLRIDRIHPMHGDASFRRYFRIHAQGHSFVVMDAPPEHENCRPYVAIANALRGMGLTTPEIYHADLARGMLVLTDFGDATYLNTLSMENADQLYQRALGALSVLQDCRAVTGHVVPAFTADFMWKEWAWHKEWVLHKMLGLSPPIAEKAIDACYEFIVQSATQQPQVFMHRDYHSANLMVLNDGNVGLLDFQDAFIGPVTYDLVSLLRDCYIDWPRDRVQDWARLYFQQLCQRGTLQNINETDFLRWFDLMGIQRHLKALLTFSRKHVRDQQSHYLQYVPRTLNYLLSVSQRYRELDMLHDYLRVTVQPAFERVLK